MLRLRELQDKSNSRLDNGVLMNTCHSDHDHGSRLSASLSPTKIPCNHQEQTSTTTHSCSTSNRHNELDQHQSVEKHQSPVQYSSHSDPAHIQANLVSDTIEGSLSQPASPPRPSTLSLSSSSASSGQSFSLIRGPTNRRASSSKSKINPAELRAQKDISEIDLEAIPGIRVDWPDVNNLMNFVVFLKPIHGLYRGAEYKFSVAIPNNYPFDAPKTQCKTMIYHPNIDWDGHVCLNILRTDWKPVLSISSVLIGLSHLLLEPNPDDPLNKGKGTRFHMKSLDLTKTWYTFVERWSTVAPTSCKNVTVEKDASSVMNMLKLWRGVAKTHPNFELAKIGIVVPGRIWLHVNDVDAHNRGHTHQSKFSSWTRDKDVAMIHAGKEGIILETYVPGKRIMWSPDIWYEHEVLVEGIVANAKVELVKIV